MTAPSTADPIARVHRRQFVIGPHKFLARSDWQTFEIGPNLALSADPELRINSATDKSGVRWLLLGLAVDTRSDFDAPIEVIAQRTTEEIPGLYRYWAGRWVLVGADSLHPDGAAMLGCYYGKSAEDALWVSSSPVLVEQAMASKRPDSARRSHERDPSSWQPAPQANIKNISWYPPPHSPVPGVFRLLPSQILDLRKGVCRYRLLVSRMEGPYTDTSICEDLQQAIATVIQRLAKINQPKAPTLLLSGGRDSRLLIGIAAAAGVSVETYTRVHRRASLADRLLPQKLAHIAGYGHSRHYQRKEVPGRRQAILEHAGYNVSWLSSEEFLRGGSDPLKGIALAGFCAELGRDRLIPVTAARAATGELIANHFQQKKQTEGKATDLKNTADLAAAFDAWIALRKEDPDTCLDLCDYFFLEQRTAGRKGAKEQIFDLFPVERVAPLNSSHIFTLIGHLSAESKRKALWINQIIKMTLPDLLQHPMNPPDKYFGLIPYLILNNRLYKRQLGLLH